ncbi:MAG: outer membrane beta-barrel protein [Flavobacteriaceae bacterium]|nr:outer membrane beta-barrel protein [Flavobacteriaceae bacterium]
MKKQILTIAMLSIAVVSFAQRYKGTVKDTQNKTIPFANVVLFSLPDSTFVTGTTTEENGQFLLKSKKKIAKGYLEVSFIGYKTKKVEAKAELGTIILPNSAIVLEEAQVIAKRLRKTPTGYSVNLTNDIRVKGVTISKTMTLMPGISKEFGVYKLNGIPISQFYVNGQKVDVGYLESVPSEMLAKAEVSFIDNIGASKSKGGVVSLTLKKPSQGGYYGNIISNISSRGKSYDRSLLSSTINYKTGKLNLIGNIRLNNNKNTTRESENTLYNNGHFFYVESENSTYSNQIIPSLSLTYELTKRQTLGFNVSGKLTYKDLDKKFENTFENTTQNFSEQLKGHNDKQQVQGVISYNLKTKKEGGNFKAQAEFFHRKQDILNNYFSDKTNIENEISHLNYTNMFNVFSRMTYPLSEHISSDIYVVWDGIAENYNPRSTHNSNDFYTNNFDDTNVFVQNPYVMAGISAKWNKFNFLARLSYQWSFLSYEIPTTNTKIKRNNQGFEPNIRISYNFGETNQHSISTEYKRSVSTFPYSLFNPNKIWADRYHYKVGNPDILTPYENSLSLSSSFWSNKLYIWTTYSAVKNNYIFATYNDPDLNGVTYTKPINALSEKEVDFGIATNLQPTKNWRLKFRGTASITKQKAEFLNENIDMNRVRYLFDFTNIYQFHKGWNLYLTTYYEPDFKSYNRKYMGVYGFDASLSKSINKTISIYFNCSAGHQRKLFTYMDNGIQTYHNKTAIPYLGFTFLWKFKGGKKVQVKKTKTSQYYKEINDVK